MTPAEGRQEGECGLVDELAAMEAITDAFRKLCAEHGWELTEFTESTPMVVFLGIGVGDNGISVSYNITNTM